MNTFTIHTCETAPPPADATLTEIGNTLGFVPNVFGVIAESTPALHAFVELNTRFADASLDATARELIQTAVSVENTCGYCVAGHTAFARVQSVPGEVIDAVREGRPIADPKLGALHRFTLALVRTRGDVPEHEMHRFLDAGYTRAQVLEVILGVCVKTFSNLASKVTGIPLDDAFAAHAWPAQRVTLGA